MRRILGIDPGTARLGYAIVDFDTKPHLITCGVIITHKDEKDEKRLSEIRADLATLIERYQPDTAVVEQLFFFKNPKTIVPVAQARGVIMELAATSGLQVYEYTPLQVKQVMTGQGRADKKLVEQMVMLEFGLTEKVKPDDAVDAVAIALTYLRSEQAAIR